MPREGRTRLPKRGPGAGAASAPGVLLVRLGWGREAQRVETLAASGRARTLAHICPNFELPGCTCCLRVCGACGAWKDAGRGEASVGPEPSAVSKEASVVSLVKGRPLAGQEGWPGLDRKGP